MVDYIKIFSSLILLSCLYYSDYLYTQLWFGFLLLIPVLFLINITLIIHTLLRKKFLVFTLLLLILFMSLVLFITDNEIIKSRRLLMGYNNYDMGVRSLILREDESFEFYISGILAFEEVHKGNYIFDKDSLYLFYPNKIDTLIITGNMLIYPNETHHFKLSNDLKINLNKFEN